MRDGENGGPNYPRQSQQRVQEDQPANDKDIQVVPRLFLEFIILPVDNDGSYVLVHEEQNGSQKGWEDCSSWSPQGKIITQGVDYETPVCLGVDATLTIEDVWDHEFRSADFGQNIHHYPYHYCYKNCKVTHHGSDIRSEKFHISYLLEVDAKDESSEK